MSSVSGTPSERYADVVRRPERRMASIPSWYVLTKTTERDFARAAHLDYVARGEARFHPNDVINRKVSLFRGDITTLVGDSVVNAANSGMLGGGGIDGAIHRAAGPQLLEECRQIPNGPNGRCPTGQVRVTNGYNLPNIIHTVGPIGENREALHSCYVNILDTVRRRRDIRTVAICGISTGIYGYPPERAAVVALSTVRRWLQRGDNADRVDRIVFVTFTQNETEIYHRYMPLFFPPTEAPLSRSQKKALLRK